MSDVQIYLTIRKHTKAAFGTGLNMHLFRDCLTTRIATENPKRVLDASVMLGHSQTMSTRVYNHAKGYEASLLFQRRITELRTVLIDNRGHPRTEPSQE